MINIIGDIAGRYNELLKLIEIMPKANKIILVGDLVDRGPDSKKVVEWAMNTPGVVTLKGNHEAMMIDAYDGGMSNSDHTHNGGRATLLSYQVANPTQYPIEHIDWMRGLPVYYREEGLYVSHAPWHRSWELGEDCGEWWALWHRDPPSYREGVYQIHGHNHLTEVYTNDGIEYGRSVDNCGRKVLQGFSWPDKVVYEVPYE